MTPTPPLIPSAAPAAPTPAPGKPPSSLGWCFLSLGLLFLSFCFHSYMDPVGEAFQRVTGEVIVRFVPPDFAATAKSMANVLVTNPSPLLVFMGVFVVTVLWPLLNSLLGASLGHLGILLTGGSAQGWHGTSRSVWLHRFWVELCSLGVLIVVCLVPLPLQYRIILLFFGLPLVRVGALLALFIHLVRTQSIGIFRSVFLLAPLLALVCTASMLVSLLSATWLSLWCLVHYL
ncbi:MAG: hypothetical protein NTX41_02430 [Verrucomicrobia bacterium]|nr:hypothetical protein [Verrucomicrobiota bacterium]